jgi:hypothetical protein
MLLRNTPAAYGPAGAPAGSTRASARVISNAVAAADAEEHLSGAHLAAFAYAWGQFIDHDLDLTNSGGDPFNIPVPAGDPYFDPNNTGTQVISLTRSQFLLDGDGVRQQLNAITAYIDGSMVYGSDAVTALSLRTLSDGRMKTSAGDLLPTDAQGFFMAGDVRANENIELTAVQTLFIREHNRLAGIIATNNPTWTDEEIYQQARRLVIGEIQRITYREFLPALLGPGALQPYQGYNANVNAGVSTEFSTAGFRLGHSMLADDVEFITDDGEEAHDEVALRDAFFNPALVQETGVDTILKYLSSSNANEIDNQIVDGVRNFLFVGPGQGGFDLASLNLQRGRDHGLSDYNDTREALGLPRVTSFDQINPDPDIQAALQAVYPDINDIDLWAGGLAERHLPNSNLGPTFQRIVADQFTRTRDGDSFWYERDLSGPDLQMVQNTSLADVIRQNTVMDNLQPDVFHFDVKIAGNIFRDVNINGVHEPGELGMGGVPVRLVDDEGNAVAQVVTQSNGNYLFDFVQVGDQTVHPVLPAGFTFTTLAERLVDVSRGQMFNNISFGVRPLRGLPQRPFVNSTASSTKDASSLVSGLDQLV